MKKLYVIDGNSLLFRAYYATSYGDASAIMKTKEGTPTNAIFAFSNMISKILSTFEGGESVFVGFDTDSKTFRKEEFEAYKANRKPAPPELVPQFPISRELLGVLGIKYYEEHGLEADDICGTVAKKAAKAGYEVIVYTSDRDYLQLIEDHIRVDLLKVGLSNIVKMDEKTMVETMGFTPRQIIDYKGLRGDSSDNLPGIPGVGEKTAVKLINEYGSFEKIVQAAKEGKIKGKVGENIINGEELGRECLKLATIKLDVELPFGLEELEYRGYEYKNVSSFANKYELKQFLSRLPSRLRKDEEEKVPEIEVLETLKGIAFPKKVGLALDMEEGNYHDTHLYGIGLYDGQRLLYVPYKDGDEDGIRAFLEDGSISKNGFDQKLIKVVSARYGISYQGEGFDILLSGYLLDSSLKDDIKDVFSSLGVDVVGKQTESLSLFEAGNKTLTARTAFYSYRLEAKARKLMEQGNTLKLYEEMEAPLSKVLGEMEIEGFPLDKETLTSLGEEYRNKKKEAEEEVYRLVGEKFNVASPKQVGDILFNKLGLADPKGGSTSVEALSQLKDAHPAVNAILEYRKYAKLVSTYIDGFLPHLKEDGKIHTCFNQAMTSTGRLSSSNPNLQNITTRDEEGRRVKKAFFYPDPHTKILSLDYGQIELRLLASMSGCQSYIDVFQGERDIHAETARKIFKIPEGEEVPHSLRRKAKAVNFAIIYGTTPFGLSEQIEGTVEEAMNVIDSFYEAYPEIKAYLDSIISSLIKQGYVETMFGRRRYLRDVSDPNYNKRMAARRAALNAPIQGSAADLIKLAMLKVDAFLKEGGYKTKMVLQIHDELIFALDENETFLVDKLKEIMVNAIPLKVKLTVEGGIGQTWYDAKE